MIELIVIVGFCVVAIRVARRVSREAMVFQEFNQSRLLALLVFLFPLGPVVLLVGVRYVPFLLAALLAIACYLPALFMARTLIKRFDSAGTDRVRSAHGASVEAHAAGIGGLIYVAVVSVISLVILGV